ncbi:Mucin-4 [Branchiostoma belcheri]|nr:Mucin-4 [Branchiostoma belcheri]
MAELNPFDFLASLADFLPGMILPPREFCRAANPSLPGNTTYTSAAKSYLRGITRVAHRKKLTRPTSLRRRLIRSCVAPDSCSDYTVLNEAWRNVQQVNDGNADRCDDGFAGQWYRFMEPAGTVMPTEAPPSVFRCGTDAPMWMNGEHPTLADGEVSRQACAYWLGNTCHWSATIQVRACLAGYFVYKLPRVPVCSLTYCGVSEGE